MEGVVQVEYWESDSMGKNLDVLTKPQMKESTVQFLQAQLAAMEKKYPQVMDPPPGCNGFQPSSCMTKDDQKIYCEGIKKEYAGDYCSLGNNGCYTASSPIVPG